MLWCFSEDVLHPSIWCFFQDLLQVKITQYQGFGLTSRMNEWSESICETIIALALVDFLATQLWRYSFWTMADFSSPSLGVNILKNNYLCANFYTQTCSEHLLRPPKMGWTAKRAPPLPLKHICCVKDEPAWVFGHFMRILSSFSQGWSVLIFLSTSSWGCAPPGENASGFFGSTFGLRSLSRKWRPKMNGNGISIINVVSMWSHKGVCWKTKARQTICKFSENLLKSQGVMSKFFIWCPMIHRTSVKLEKKLTPRPWKWVVSQKERIIFQPSAFQGLC